MSDKTSVRVIVNPTAAAGAVGREWSDLRSFMAERGLEFEASLTEAPGHATALAQEAVGDGVRMVVAVGGDGTLNEIANGLLMGRSASPVELGIISRGTGCDLVRTLNLRDPRQAVEALTEREQRLTIDLGEILTTRAGGPQRRVFINAAGMGFDGEVVEALVSARLSGRSVGGTVPYLLQALRSLLVYRSKQVRVLMDGAEHRGSATAVFACLGKYLGGGMQVAPRAVLDDGFFEIVRIEGMSRLELLATLPSLYSGKLEKSPKVTSTLGREVTVETDDRMVIQADGELVGTAPATIRLLPRALTLRV